MEYRELYSQTSSGNYSHGIKIEIATHPVELSKDDEIMRRAAYEAAAILENAIMRAQRAADPETAEQSLSQKQTLLGCFDAPIYVEEIPNGYCSRGCCAHLPWFVVTTHVGRIKIGWRKSVILIDWSETKNTKTSMELFKSEDVTKDIRMIHAWGYDKAAEYVKAIVGSATPATL